MKTKILRTEQEYNEACERIYSLINSTENQIEPNSPEGEEMELLSLLAEKYEQDHCQSGNISPEKAKQQYFKKLRCD